MAGDYNLGLGLGLPEDEEQRQRYLDMLAARGVGTIAEGSGPANNDAPPVVAPKAKAEASDTPPVPNSASALGGAERGPEVRLEGDVNAPPVKGHAALSPARARLQALVDQGAPPVTEYHGAKKFFDTLGKIFVPNIEQRLTGGAQKRYAENLGQAEVEVKADEQLHPHAAPENDKWKVVPGMVGPGGKLVQEEENSGQIRYAPELEGIHSVKDAPTGTPAEQTFRQHMTGGPNGGPEVNPDTQKPYTVDEALASTQKPQHETGVDADIAYRALVKKEQLGQPLSKEEQADKKAYEKQKLLVPTTTANIKVEGMNQMRQYPVWDAKNGMAVYMNPEDITRAQKAEPGRYTVPNYSPGALQTAGAARASVTPGVANEIVAFNTATQHADLLEQASVAMNNGDMRSLNKLANALGVEFGSDAATNYRVIAGAYAREVNKALTAGHVTDSEIHEAAATIPDNASPEQIVGAVKAYKALMQSKLQMRKQQFEAASKGQLPFGQEQAGQPKVGDTKTFPNGKKATWDGHGWAAQ